MARAMKMTAGVSCLLTAVFAWIYIQFRLDLMETFAVTFGTIAYHFCMRLAVGGIFNSAMKNRADYTRRWFRTSKLEARIYKALHVKDWKNRMPTYNKSCFDASRHSYDEIAQAMCQSELVHETIIAFSFLPVIASVWFGALPVFLITSVVSACFDGMFVIMQRYNRPRVLRLIKRQNKQQSR